MSRSGKYRSKSSAQQLIAISISNDLNHMLARGLGLEHLRELLLRLARPLLRSGASLAYGGHWREEPGNFTYELLRLISAEQEDNSAGGPESAVPIGRLFNHLAWPFYLDVTPRIEAQWINCCRIIRISQEIAGIAPSNILSDGQDPLNEGRALLNSAITLSAMRRMATVGMSVPVVGIGTVETIPPISARILLGGKTSDYAGFIPGIFEEALLALEHQCPLYIVGGFGGAAEALAHALLGAAGTTVDELRTEWQEASTPKLKQLNLLADAASLPAGVRSTAASLEALALQIDNARPRLAEALRTGLGEAETRELLSTRDIRRGVQLVLNGLSKTVGLMALPA
jgi:hypothetical protein